jgi:hypothetical protein
VKPWREIRAEKLTAMTQEQRDRYDTGYIQGLQDIIGDQIAWIKILEGHIGNEAVEALWEQYKKPHAMGALPPEGVDPDTGLWKEDLGSQYLEAVTKKIPFTPEVEAAFQQWLDKDS